MQAEAAEASRDYGDECFPSFDLSKTISVGVAKQSSGA